jgi:oxalate decarboxylase
LLSDPANDLSLHSIISRGGGMREPHWHPETAEMGYAQSGRAAMTVLNPDGSTETWRMGPGDVYFIPHAYPHHIEVLGPDEIHLLIFFDQPIPGDIGSALRPPHFPLRSWQRCSAAACAVAGIPADLRRSIDRRADQPARQARIAPAPSRADLLRGFVAAAMAS